MREILFRGKRIDNGEWVVGITWIFSPPVDKAVIVYAMGLVGEDDDASRYCECHEVDPSTIGQYTGLTANGKKIFEGDIVATPKYNGVVVYGTGCYCIKHGNNSPAIDIVMNVFDVYIIGNIHDNPELMEDKP